jgi:hypothetical protein
MDARLKLRRTVRGDTPSNLLDAPGCREAA